MGVLRGEARKLIEQTVAEVLAHLRDEPADPVALWWADFLGQHLPRPSPEHTAARARFVKARRRLGARRLEASLRERGTARLLGQLWRALLELHHDGALLEEIAGWLARLCADAKELSSLAFVPDQFNASWGGVGHHAARAAERLAAAALALDPENEGALYLYAQEGFLRAVNRGRPAAERISGPPIPERPASREVKKVQQIVFAFEAGEHPLDLFCRMDTVPVKSDEVVDALIRGLACQEWRGQSACCEALGRARLGVARIVPALCDRLLRGEESVPGHAAEALAELAKRAPAAVAAGAVPALVERIRRDPRFDVWEQHEVADALLALAPRAPAGERPAVVACLQALVERTRKLGKEKLAFYGYTDFLGGAEEALEKLAGALPVSRGSTGRRRRPAGR